MRLVSSDTVARAATSWPRAEHQSTMNSPLRSSCSPSAHRSETVSTPILTPWVTPDKPNYLWIVPSV